MYAPGLVVTITDQREPEPDPESDSAVLSALANLLLDEFDDLNDAREGEHIVDVFRRKLEELRKFRTIC